MKRTMTAGPMATAASVLGETADIASPMDEDVNDSRVSTAQKRPKCANVGCNPVIGYTVAPNARGKNAPTGSSASNFPVKYGSTP
mmetsp:Transcript_7154/g.23642  ORF Transcript_7154/g.23642 Transcript_7154/m.23642 type:complete len:85 (+) Transcript_7154:356-610(+)